MQKKKKKNELLSSGSKNSERFLPIIFGIHAKLSAGSTAHTGGKRGRGGEVYVQNTFLLMLATKQHCVHVGRKEKKNKRFLSLFHHDWITPIVPQLQTPKQLESTCLHTSLNFFLSKRRRVKSFHIRPAEAGLENKKKFGTSRTSARGNKNKKTKQKRRSRKS